MVVGRRAANDNGVVRAKMNATEAHTMTIDQVGILSAFDANGEKDVWDAFKDGLTELGYSEGKGVTFVSRCQRLPPISYSSA